MNDSRARWWHRAGVFAQLAGTSGVLAGCLSHSVDRVPNVERAAIVWRQRDNDKGAICLEYSTAAHELKSQRAGLELTPVPGKSVALSFESSASLAQIYTVSDIMQFGHAALYRLCEAANNGKLNNTEYRELVDATLKRLTTLMKLQTTATNQRFIGRLFEKKETIEGLKKKIADLDRNPSTAEPGRRAFLEASLREEQTEFDELVRANRLEDLFDESKGGEATESTTPADKTAPQGATAPSKAPAGSTPPATPPAKTKQPR